MTQNTSYPSPNAPQMGEGTHPFYTNQHPMPSNDDLRLSPQPPPNIQTGRTTNEEDGSRVVQSSPRLQDLRQGNLPSPQQLAQGGLETADSAGKPRTKVSRACDECRRKKIRCDADIETPGVFCTNCQKSSTDCMFTKVPGKRGPSKGYIRELADRVNALEESTRPLEMPYVAMSHQPTSPQGFNSYSAQLEEAVYGSRKRTHSMSEGMQNSGYMRGHFDELNGRYQSTQSMEWTNHSIARQSPASQPSVAYQPQHSQQPGTYVDTGCNAHISHPSPSEVSSGIRNPSNLVLDAVEARAGEVDNRTEVNFELNEQAMDEYYHRIHPIFPILPSTKTKLKYNLAKAPATIREALLSALYAATPLPGSSMGNAKKVSEQLVTLQLGDLTTRSISDNLLYLQALLLMGLANSSSGPIQAQQSSWINLALSVSTFLKLYSHNPHEHVVGSDIDTNENVGRRAWLVLVVMDRWNAAGTRLPLLIADGQAKMYRGDGVLLGNIGFQFARLSITLGHLVDATLDHFANTKFASYSRYIVSREILSEIERFRENAEPLMSSWPFLNLAYWHVKLLMEPYTVEYVIYTGDKLGMAFKMTTILCSNTHPISPLAHHFTALAANTFLDNLATNHSNKDVRRALDDLWSGLEDGRILARSSQVDNKPGWATAIQDAIGKKMQHLQQQQQAPANNDTAIDRGGLQHLADAAVGESENMSNGGEKGKEGAPSLLEAEVAVSGWGMAPVSGYLNGFV